MPFAFCFFKEMLLSPLHPQNIYCLSSFHNCCTNNSEEDNEINLAGSLCKACFHGHFDCIKMLIKAGADPNGRDKHGSLPIVRSANNGDVKILKFLLDSGTKINDSDSRTGRTALHNAVSHGYYDMILFLLGNGADITEVSKKGETPLHLVFNSYKANDDFNDDVRDDNIDKIIKLLIDNGANINVQTSYDMTLLHYAITRGQYPETIKLILENGANPNIKNWRGETPLHLMAKYNNFNYNGITSEQAIECAKLLLDNGASLNTMNNDGKTPLHLAQNLGADYIDEMMIEFLRTYQNLPE